MFTIKSIVLRCLEVYETEQDTPKGMIAFYNAFYHSQVYLYNFKEKELDLREYAAINRLLNLFVLEKDTKAKNKILVMLKRTANEKYSSIHRFLELDEIKNSTFIPESELNLDRTHIVGCVGTVVEE
jgi:hypothetical protein